MLVLGPADKTDGRHAEAIPVEPLVGGRHQGLVTREPQVIVGAEVQHLLALNLDGRPLRTEELTLLLVETAVPDVGEGLIQAISELVVHGNGLSFSDMRGPVR